MHGLVHRLRARLLGGGATGTVRRVARVEVGATGALFVGAALLSSIERAEPVVRGGAIL